MFSGFSTLAHLERHVSLAWRVHRSCRGLADEPLLLVIAVPLCPATRPSTSSSFGQPAAGLARGARPTRRWRPARAGGTAQAACIATAIATFSGWTYFSFRQGCQPFVCRSVFKTFGLARCTSTFSYTAIGGVAFLHTAMGSTLSNQACEYERLNRCYQSRVKACELEVAKTYTVFECVCLCVCYVR